MTARPESTLRRDSPLRLIPAPSVVHDAAEPTLGEIKLALHELTRLACGPSHPGKAASLRQLHEQLRELARLQGIDADLAVDRRRAQLQSQRQRMAAAPVLTD